MNMYIASCIAQVTRRPSTYSSTTKTVLLGRRLCAGGFGTFWPYCDQKGQNLEHTCISCFWSTLQFRAITNSRQISYQSIFQKSCKNLTNYNWASYRLVLAKGGFQEKLWIYSEMRRINLEMFGGFPLLDLQAEQKALLFSHFYGFKENIIINSWVK